MAKNIVEKLLSEAEKTMESYAYIEVFEEGISFGLGYLAIFY